MSLNKPATAASVAARWYLRDSGFLALGKSEGVIPPDSHHAIQIVVATEGTVAVKGARRDWRAGRGVTVRQDVEHTYDGKGAIGAMIFVDPESYEGAWLQTALTEDIAVVPDADERLCGGAEHVVEKPLKAMPIADLIRHCVPSQCAGAPPLRRLDERVTKVLTAIQYGVSFNTACATGCDTAPR